MNRILNPFEYLSTGKAFGWGLAGVIFSVVLLIYAIGPIEGDYTKLFIVFTSNLLLWLPLSLLLYLAALILSPSRIRAVDIFVSNLFALLPTIVGLGVLNMLSVAFSGIECEPRSTAEVAVHAAEYLMVILLSVTMVWSMVWGCFAYQVSANMKGMRSVVIFVGCFVLVNVINQLLVEYL